MSGLRGVPTRLLVTAGLLVALLLAGVASYYAASSPDGLNRVAQDQGFASAAEQRNDVAPFAGYETAGVDHGRVSGGLAGVAGCLVVLVLVGGTTRALRTRRRAADHSTADNSTADPVAARSADPVPHP
jgi:cobalt/nickel transport protein